MMIRANGGGIKRQPTNLQKDGLCVNELYLSIHYPCSTLEISH